MAKTTIRRRWREQDAIRRGREALSLVGQAGAELTGRLPAGTVDSLTTNIGLLTAAGPDRIAALTMQKGATGDERSIAADAKDWVMATRELGKRTPDLTKGDLKALGVGERIRSSSTNVVAAALTATLRTCNKRPQLAQKIGLLQSDLDEAGAMLDTLMRADDRQAEVMGLRKDKTFDRTAAQLRIEAAVDMISSRGRMAFRKDPQLRARYEALVSKSGPAVKATEPAGE